MCARDDLRVDRSPVRVGGGELLYSFFEGAHRLAVERLYVIAPYVDDNGLEDASLRDRWQSLVRSARVTVVVRTPASANAVMKTVPGRLAQRIDLRLDPKLHSKLFVGIAQHESIVLMGSANLTGAALHANVELGLLFLSQRAGDARFCERLTSSAMEAARCSSPYAIRRGRDDIP